MTILITGNTKLLAVSSRPLLDGRTVLLKKLLLTCTAQPVPRKMKEGGGGVDCHGLASHPGKVGGGAKKWGESEMLYEMSLEARS